MITLVQYSRTLSYFRGRWDLMAEYVLQLLYRLILACNPTCWSKPIRTFSHSAMSFSSFAFLYSTSSWRVEVDGGLGNYLMQRLEISPYRLWMRIPSRIGHIKTRITTDVCDLLIIETYSTLSFSAISSMLLLFIFELGKTKPLWRQ